MRLTVCEFPDEHHLKDKAWSVLVEHCRAEQSDLVLLPEMPFCDWQMFMSREVDLRQWNDAITVHDHQIERLAELGGAAVLSSRPTDIDGKRLNQAFAWSEEDGYVGSHCKYYLPG